MSRAPLPLVRVFFPLAGDLKKKAKSEKKSVRVFATRFRENFFRVSLFSLFFFLAKIKVADFEKTVG